MPTIALSMIVRNVATIIGNCLDSVVPFVDEIVIVDTGSTDTTKSVILNHAPSAKIFDYNEKTNPEGFLHDVQESWEEKLPGQFTGRQMLANFGAARQSGLARCTSDYVLWIDSDDVLVDGQNLRELVELMARERVDTAMLTYDYASDGQGNVTCQLTRERVIRRAGPSVWCQPIHEVLSPPGNVRFFDTLKVKHRRHEYRLGPEVANRNLKVLLNWFYGKDENTCDPRMLFYLAMEERWLWPERSIKHYRKYCERSGWDEERAKAHIYAGMIHEDKGAHQEAFSEYAQAALEASFDPDPYFGAARMAYFKMDYGKCAEWTETGFRIMSDDKSRRSLIMANPTERMWRPHVFYSFALIKLGRYKEASDTCNSALKWAPADEPHLRPNRDFADSCLNDEKSGAAVSVSLNFRLGEALSEPLRDVPSNVTTWFAIHFWKALLTQGHRDKALALLDLFPSGMVYEDKLREMREFIDSGKEIGTVAKALEIAPTVDEPLPQEDPDPEFPASPLVELADEPLNIIFWLGASWEKWSPETIKKTGMGGSEIAAVVMARSLALLGHNVMVYSDCEGYQGFYDGVAYVPYKYHYESDLPQSARECDIFISSRQAAAFKSGEKWKYKASFLWVHDIHVGQPNAAMSEALFRVDGFFCLSNWHKKFFLETYPFLHADSVIVTRNGIDVERFRNVPNKIGNRLIYSSSPDRGLEVLLNLLPKIRERVSDVILHVYYGFENWKAMAQSMGNKDQIERVDYFERRLAEEASKGHLVYHGRVNQEQLAAAFLASKVWAYPTWFTETYCISAIESMAAGCVPVTTNLAALTETVKHGIIIPGSNTDEDYQAAFVNSVVDLLTDEDGRQKIARQGRQYALTNCDWLSVAVEWSEIFKRMLAKKSDPLSLPAFGDF